MVGDFQNPPGLWDPSQPTLGKPALARDLDVQRSLPFYDLLKNKDIMPSSRTQPLNGFFPKGREVPSAHLTKAITTSSSKMWKCSRAQNILFMNLQCQILHLGKIAAPSSKEAFLNEVVWQSLLKGENNQQPGWTRGKPSVCLGFRYRKLNHIDCCWPHLESSMDHYAKVSNPLPKTSILLQLHTNLLGHT